MRVRMLTLEKILNYSQYWEKDPPKDCLDSNAWITLGHTDIMKTSVVNQMTLDDLHANNKATYQKNSEYAYHQTIYLVDHAGKGPEFIQSEQSDSAFWSDANQSFLAVTRIHFKGPTQLYDQFHFLSQCIAHYLKKDYFQTVKWHIYNAVELSDLLLVCKSASFSELSKCILHLTKFDFIGKSYTYFCIPYCLLSKCTSDSDCNKEICDFLKKDSIDFVAIRSPNLSPTASACIQKYMSQENSSDPFYRITGNEDEIFCQYSVSTYNLVCLYREWFNLIGPQSDTLLPHRRIITRIGILDNTEETFTLNDFENLSNVGFSIDERVAEDKSKLMELAKQTLKTSQKIPLRDNKQEFSPSVERNSQDWILPLYELSSAMVHMSRTATLDETAFMILPGLSAFWKNIKNERYLSAAFSLNDDQKLYLEFAELCVSTCEHLMRAEAQLSQRTEVRPLTYDIPIFILECANSVLYQFQKILEHPDLLTINNSFHPISFLLAPCAIPSVSTVELFSYREADNNHPELPGLLQITVPFSLMYDPDMLLPALCHETAHYVGESIRMRKQRHLAFMQCAACEMIRYFFEAASPDVSDFQEFLATTLTDSLVQAARENFNALHKNDIPSPEAIFDPDSVWKYPLRFTILSVCQIAKDLQNPDSYLSLIQSYLAQPHSTLFLTHSDFRRKEDAQLFQSRLNDIALGFREIYADLCMMYFLNLEIEKYLKVTINPEEKLNHGLYTRMYICLHLFNYSRLDIEQAFKEFLQQNYTGDTLNTNLSTMYDEFNGLDAIIFGKDTASNSTRILYQFMLQCKTNLEEVYDQNPDTKNAILQLRKDYNTILMLNKKSDPCDFSYTSILDIIDRGRLLYLHADASNARPSIPVQDDLS